MPVSKVVNLTRHTLTFVDPVNTEKWESVEPDSRGPARVNSELAETEQVRLGQIDLPILEVKSRYLAHLPDPEDGVLYVVSGLVASVAYRPDVVAPARTWRDPSGEIQGARALLRY
jgi:hypothetical protein